MMHIKKLYLSIKYAWSGLNYIYKSEQNFRIQLLVAIVVIVAGLFVNISSREWVVIFLLITLVLILEIINTVLEKLIDIIKPKIHHYVRIIKDLMAAAVLLSSLAAAVIGIMIFYPYLKQFLS